MKKYAHLLILTAIITLFGAIIVFETAQTGYLYSYDPWEHHYFSKYVESRDFYSKSLEIHNGTYDTPYRSFLRSNMYLSSLTTGVDIFQVTRFTGVFLRVLFILLAYMVVNLFTKDKWIALLVTVLIFSSYYFAWRSYLAFPENMVVLFYLLAIWAFEKYRSCQKTVLLFFIGLSLIGSVLIHPKSIYITGFIFTAYLAYFLISKNTKAVKQVVITVLVGILVCLPVLVDTLSLVFHTLVYNVGETSEQGLVSQSAAQYAAPTFVTYQKHIGAPVVLLTVLGLVYLARKDLKRNLPILLIFALTFILSLGTHLQIYVPTDRMQAYLFLPVIVIASIFLKFLFREMGGRYDIPIITACILVLSVFNLTDAPPWFAFWHGEIEITQAINDLLERDEQALVFIEPDCSQLYALVEYPEDICFAEGSYGFSLSDNTTHHSECLTADLWLSKSTHPPEGYSQIRQEGDYYLFRRYE